MLLRALDRNEAAATAARTLIGHPNLVVQGIGNIELAQRSGQRANHRGRPGGQRSRHLSQSGRGGQCARVDSDAGASRRIFFAVRSEGQGRAVLTAAIKQVRLAQGPDEWAQALFTLEAIAKAARQAGDWEFATTVAAQMLDHDPAYGGTHYAVGLAAEHRGDLKTARQEF